MSKPQSPDLDPNTAASSSTANSESLDFRRAAFVTSAARLSECPANSVTEVAFAGRSNAGKSSAINALTGQSRLARISKTPGRTQLINFFALQPGEPDATVAQRYLVDLPGYGFAKVPLSVKEKWQFELEQYLRKRQQLVGLVLLSDVRHPMKEFDQMMVAWARESNLPLLLLLTKADKLKRGPAQNALLKVRKDVSGAGEINVQLFSSVTGQGIDAARQQLSAWLSEPAMAESGSPPVDSEV
jgi:GTP-binding protein